MVIHLAVLLAVWCGSVQDVPARSPVTLIPADLEAEELFDPLRPVADFEGEGARWTPVPGKQHAAASSTRDASVARGGAASLRVDYEFTGRKDLEYLELPVGAELPGPGLGFGFWIRGDGMPFILRVRFADASGETHQADLLPRRGQGWCYAAVSADAPAACWGGDGNRRLDYPCKVSSIILDRPGAGFAAKGSFWIDDAAVVKPAPAARASISAELANLRFGHLYAPGDAVELRVKGEGETLRWRVADAFGRELAAGEGPGSGTDVRFVLPRPGWYGCRVELRSGGRLEGAQVLACAALPAAADPPASDFLGVCTHFGQNAYPLEIMDLMKRCGLVRFRDEISWGACEPRKGVRALPSWADAYLARSARLGLKPLIIFDYANPHYDRGGFPNSPEAIEGFARYAVDLVRWSRGRADAYEVWNEWVGGCGMNGRPGAHDGAAYGRLLKPTYEAVKEAFPGATVVGIGGEYGPRCADHIVEAVSTAGPSAMDAWSIHPYRYPGAPEDSGLVEEVRGIASRVASAGVTTKAWITEIGWPTHRGGGGSEELAQAKYLVRTVALLQAMPEVEKLYWYDLKDDGLERGYNEANFGLVRHQRYHCAPKPGLVAAATFIRFTAGALPGGLTRDGDLFQAAYRRPDGSRLLLAWTSRGGRRVGVQGVDSATDLMGAPIPADPEIVVGGEPVYFLGRDPRIEGR